MGSGGSIRKLILDGKTFQVSADNDSKFTPGGRYATEKQETNGEPFFLFDFISACQTGLEIRLSHADGTLSTFKSVVDKCAKNGAVSAMVIQPDGTKYSAKGGAVVIVDGAAEGAMSIREGKVTFALHPKSGEWVAA